MKKQIFKVVLIIGIAVLIAILTGFNEPRKLKVEGVVEQWQMTIDVIEQSNAPHLQVEAVKKFLLPQLQSQLTDTTKKK